MVMLGFERPKIRETTTSGMPWLSFLLPVVITCDLHARLLPDDAEIAAGENYIYRLGEVLTKAWEAVQAEKPGESRILFQAFLQERYATGQWKLNRLDLWCCRQGKGYVIGYPEDFSTPK